MTEDDFAAEEYRQQRKAKGWCPFIALGLAVLAVGSFRLMAAVADRTFR